jgi:hypothetical protein
MVFFSSESSRSFYQLIRNTLRSNLSYYFLVASLATIYILIILSPIFQFSFNEDDFVMLELGAILKHNPWGFIFFTYCGWWRPLGFSGSAFMYQLFGLNPFPYHVAGFFIHLITAILVVIIARRLFDLRTGLIAYIFYITSTLGVSSVGFISNSYQDELGAAFIILAMLSSIRISGNSSRRRGPYFAATLFLFLSAACKESWIAYIPVAIYIDIWNYRRSSFWQRLMRIIPLLIVFGMFYFRARFGGSLSWEGPLFYFKRTFGLDNLLWGATLPFLPFGVAYDAFLVQGFWDWSRIFVPITIFGLAWFLKKDGRWKIGFLLVTFISFLLILASSFLNNEFWEWYHLPIPLTVAVILMAIPIEMFLKRFSTIWAYLMVLLFLAGYSYLQFFMIRDNMKDCWEKTRAVKVHLNSFQSCASKIKPGSMLVAFDGPTYQLALDSLIPNGVTYRSVLSKEAGNSMKAWMQSPMDYVREVVGDRALAPDTYYIGRVNGVWKDYTKEVKSKLKAELDDNQHPGE